MNSLICRHCQQENRAGARFCSGCGQSLATQVAPAMQKPESVDIFLLYSHEDEEMKKEFLKHMAILRRTGRALVWHDRDIEGGEEIHKQVDAHLAAANIILMLISASFIASDYCYSEKMQDAMKRHERGTAKVVPIIIKPVDWQETPFHKPQALPRELKKPISMCANQDEAWLEVVQRIREIL